MYISLYNIKEKDSQVTKSGNVKFFSAGKYLFDTYDDYTNAAKGYAERFPSIGEGDYKPAYACVESNTKLEIKAEPYKTYTFKNERGVPVLCKDGILEVTARGDRDTTSIYAYDADNHIVGKVNVLSYDKVTRKICLVPIGDTKAPDASAVKQGLDEIFAKLMVDFDVTIGEPITIQYAKNNKFTHGGSGMIGVYNTDQKAAISKLKERGIDNETVYLFFVKECNALKANDSPDVVNGYMPVGRHYGFIYNEYTNARTIAHELGHGTNSLHHTFSQESESFYTTEKTDNLMDYNGGEYLNHRQWQWSHEKHRNVLGFLDDEEESEQKIKEDPLQKMGIVYMTEKWEQGVTYSSEELPKPPQELNGIASEMLRNAINKYVSKTESFKSIKELLSTKQNVIRIIDRNTIQDQRGSTNIMGCNKKTKKSDYVKNIVSNMLATPNDYYLIDRIYIYTESFKIEGLSENEKMMLMTIVLGHELFIHYNNIKAISLWQQGKYKEALELATKDTGPNNGDYNHRDYINRKINDEGIAIMYKYLDELRTIIETEKASVTKKDFNKAKEEHDKSYKRLKNKNQ